MVFLLSKNFSFFIHTMSNQEGRVQNQVTWDDMLFDPQKRDERRGRRDAATFCQKALTFSSQSHQFCVMSCTPTFVTHFFSRPRLPLSCYYVDFGDNEKMNFLRSRLSHSHSSIQTFLVQRETIPFQFGRWQNLTPICQ